MGFPENECRAALVASMGNPDLAYEFLLSGIPPSLAASSAAATAATTSAAASQQATPATGIDQLRQHPQFNSLKTLLQRNPACLPEVLDVIGQQSPALLAEIHANNEAFIAMMNEPIQPAATAVPPPPSASAGSASLDAANMVRMLGSLQPAQRAQFAQSMGMSPDQLESFMTMMSSMPPEALQSILGGEGTTST